jgi:hypothetical protein
MKHWILSLVLAGQAALAVAQVRIDASVGHFVRDYPVNPLAIVSFQVRVRTSPGVQVHSFIRFFDKTNREILRYEGGPVSDTSFTGVGYYTEAPALAHHLSLGIETTGDSTGSVWLDSLQADLDAGAPLAYHAPRVDLDAYLKPFWRPGPVTNETVLLYTEKGAPATGRLLYQPDHILSVRSFDGKTTYREGKDYTWNGRTLTRLEGSAMPWRAETSPGSTSSPNGSSYPTRTTIAGRAPSPPTKADCCPARGPSSKPAPPYASWPTA